MAVHRLKTKMNSQPYGYKNILFAHNGEISIPDEVARHMGPYRRKVRGLNDSEVYFWQFIKFYEKTRDVSRALRACVRETIEIFKDRPVKYSDRKYPYLGLNTLVSDGEALYAMSHFPKLKKDRGILNPRQPWGRMSFQFSRTQVRVASENLSRGKWQRLGAAEIAAFRPVGNSLVVTRGTFRPGH